MKAMTCTDSKVEAMFKLLLSNEKDQDKKQKVLVRELGCPSVMGWAKCAASDELVILKAEVCK